MKLVRFAALVAGLALAGAAAPPPARDWTRVAVATPAGGIRVGNPRAAKRFVEVANYTCGHCAHFSESGAPTLARAIRAGTLAMEVRPFVGDPIGLAATVVARCAPERFLAVNDALYARQRTWIDASVAYLEAAGTAAQGAAPAQLRAIAERGGISAIATANGVAAPRLAACFANRAQLDTILKTSAAMQPQITGTPAFQVGGTGAFESLDWAGLAARLGLGT